LTNAVVSMQISSHTQHGHSSDIDYKLWHKRPGHSPISKLRYITSLPCKNSTSQKVCITCPMAKFTKLPYPVSQNKSGVAFKLIHIDIWGPYKVKASCGANYFLTIVDDANRATWVYPMKEKGKVDLLLKGFVAMISNQFKKNAKIVRSDSLSLGPCTSSILITA